MAMTYELFKLYLNSALPIAYRLVRLKDGDGNTENKLQGRFVFSDGPGNVYKEWRDLETIEEPMRKGPSEGDLSELYYRSCGGASTMGEVSFEGAIKEALNRWGNIGG